MNREAEVHLRSTHFALVITSFALLVAASLPPPRLYDLASQQLAAIQLAASHWNVTNARQALLNEAAAEGQGASPGGRDVVALFRSEIWWGQAFQGKTSTQIRYAVGPRPGTTNRVVMLPNGDHAGILCPGASALPKELSTLSSFQVLWEELRNVGCVEALGLEPCSASAQMSLNMDLPSGFTSDSHAGSRCRFKSHTWRPPPYTSRSRHFAVTWSLEPIDNHSEEYLAVARAVRDAETPEDSGGSRSVRTGRGLFAVPVRAQTLTIDGQPFLRSLLGSGSWRSGSFATVFPELDEVTRGHSRIDLQELSGLIRGEADRAGNQVTLFGVQIAPNLLSVWGLIVLAFVELYFGLFLVWYARTYAAAVSRWVDFPWLGFFDSRLARAVVVGSTICLPLLAVGVIVVGNGFGDARREVLGRMLAAMTVIGTTVWTTRALLVLWRSMAGGGKNPLNPWQPFNEQGRS